MLIRDLEEKTGLDRATIRYYEKEGLITPVRQENGYREYSQADCDTLLKIKLLRQLGMSLLRIQGLQQGSDDFRQALDEQISSLEKQIQASTRAKEVCVEMRRDGVSYAGLDAAYYLDLLSQPSQQKIPAVFTENINVEIHPWRRYFARMLDVSVFTLLCQILIVVVLRIRPYSDFISFVITYGSPFLLIPIEAFLLHKLGTTPGKWVMGIRVESCDGGRLDFDAAMEREWNVLRYGMGWGIPIYEIWRNYRCFMDYSDTGRTEYEGSSEILFEEWTTRRKVLIAGVYAALIALTLFVALDIPMPTYRGEDLTIAQFAENYNDLCEMYAEEGATFTRLKSDGTWDASQNDGEYVVYLNETANQYEPFTYVTENGFIREIHYSNTWTQVNYSEPLMGQRYVAAFVMLMSQKETGLTEIGQFESFYQEQVDKGEPSGSFTYKNIEVTWNIEARNCESIGGAYWSLDENVDSSLELTYSVLIH